MKRTLALLLLAASVSPSAADPPVSQAEDRAAGGGDAAKPEESRCLVGVYYFAGWWEPLPNKYAPHGRDWREDYPGRVPLLGQYNDQPTMDKEIVAAARYGVDFFQILWYPVEDTRRRSAAEGRPMPPHVENVNEGLRLFLNSAENRRIRFTVEYVNHAPFGILDPAEWEKYNLMPLELVNTPDSPFAAVLGDVLAQNLDFEVDHQHADGSWKPKWTWGPLYPNVWEQAKQEWSGVITLRTLKTLRNFGRLA